jgi:isoquinoline 1-oxidoreductase subunit alpha
MLDLSINGQRHPLEVEPEMPMLWVLRDALGLTGTKFGCGIRPGSHPVQRAWLAGQVPQCGYCRSGQIMSAAALLARSPRPTDAEVDTALSGNICRCGTYNSIRRAIAMAAGGAVARAISATPPAAMF